MINFQGNRLIFQSRRLELGFEQKLVGKKARKK
jgi:hypothetical protein